MLKKSVASFAMSDSSKERHIDVEPRRPVVVVAGGKMHVAPDALGLAPHDEQDLRVNLEARDAVHTMTPASSSRCAQEILRAFVKTRLDLDEHGNVLAARAARSSARTIGESPDVRYNSS
jgi:hypothetical protein